MYTVKFVYKFILIIIFLSIISCKTKSFFSIDNFETEIFNYKPLQKESVSNENFKKSVSILGYSIESIKNDNYNFTVTDYWNFTIALALLNEKKENIQIPFNKGVAQNRMKMCEYIIATMKTSKATIDLLALTIPDSFNSVSDSCNFYSNTSIINKLENDSLKSNNILLELMDSIRVSDQKYRKNLEYLTANIDKQDSLDKRNQILIDSLYSKYNKYLGKSIVGKKYEVTMWAVIQHSNIEMMKRYLPIVHQAVIEGELPLGPLEMLIDRIYTIETGKQIFGSQGGVEISAESIVNEVKEKYNIKL